MSQPFSSQEMTDDLHLLVTVAILTGQRGLVLPLAPIYEAWSAAYPEDALGPVGLGLGMVGGGDFEGGLDLIKTAAENSKTRAEQAVDVLRSIQASLTASAGAAMEINRADMKLLIETAYSTVLRNLDTDVTEIFEALETWMPDYAAGRIGTALQMMVAGEFDEASDLLNELIRTKKHGTGEARAMLALCKALQDEWVQAEQLAEELEGEGSSAETFSRLLVHGPTPEELAESEAAMAQTAAE